MRRWLFSLPGVRAGYPTNIHHIVAEPGRAVLIHAGAGDEDNEVGARYDRW